MTVEASLATGVSQPSLSHSGSGRSSPLRTHLILWPVLWVLLRFPVLRRGHQQRWAGRVPGTLKAVSLAPRSLQAGREGKKKCVWFVCLVLRTFRGCVRDPLGHREWLLALQNGVSYAHRVTRGREQGVPHTLLPFLLRNVTNESPGGLLNRKSCPNQLLVQLFPLK